jgi:hypothetical protein
MMQALRVHFAETRDRRPLVVIDEAIGLDAELTPERLCALAVAMLQAAADATTWHRSERRTRVARAYDLIELERNDPRKRMTAQPGG